MPTSLAWAGPSSKIPTGQTEFFVSCSSPFWGSTQSVWLTATGSRTLFAQTACIRLPLHDKGPTILDKSKFTWQEKTVSCHRIPLRNVPLLQGTGRGTCSGLHLRERTAFIHKDEGGIPFPQSKKAVKSMISRLFCTFQEIFWDPRLERFIVNGKHAPARFASRRDKKKARSSTSIPAG